MEFIAGVLKIRMKKLQGSIKKTKGIPRGDQEKNCQELPWVLVFSLENSNGVTKFRGISRDEVSFRLEFPRVE